MTQPGVFPVIEDYLEALEDVRDAAEAMLRVSVPPIDKLLLIAARVRLRAALKRVEDAK